MSRIARTFSIILPKLCRAAAGEVFTAGSYITREGSLPTLLQASRLHGGSIGSHASAIGADRSLCNLPLQSATKDEGTLTVLATDSSRKRDAAKAVTCKFCLCRLLNAGALAEADISSATKAADRAYAIDYASRVPADEVAAIDARAAEAEAAAAKAAAKAARAAKAAAKAAAAK